MSDPVDVGEDLFDEPGVVVKGVFRCERPSRYAGWLLADGTVVPARCGASNKCAYCAYRRVLEDALMLALDAEEWGHPRVGMTLTTVDPQHDTARFRRDVEKTIKAIRHRLGDDVAYLGFMEWTTGRAKRSGGHRRAHQHILLRNCLPSDAEAIEPDIRRVWEARTGASRVELRELRTPAGAIAYLVHHHRKRDQAPPEGWNGRRLRYSKNYFSVDSEARRAEATKLLRSKRLRRVANRLMAWEGLDGAPDEILDEEWASALAEAKREAAMVTFVKLDSYGRISSFTRSDGQPDAGRAPVADELRDMRRIA